MTATYATLAEARSEDKATSTTDDDKLMRAVFAASGRIDGVFQSRYRYFMPWIRTITFPIREYMVDSVVNTLALPYPLLSLTSITYNGSAMTVGTSVEAYPSGVTPYKVLRMMTFAYDWYNFVAWSSSYPEPLVSITGVWGYHGDYVNAWLSVDTLAAAIVTTTATTLTVADVDGDDAFGFGPRISRGHLIKVDDEYMEVTDTNTTTNVVTVRRGANGSTAATHLISAAVYTWQVEENVKRVTARQASLLYARRGAFEVSTLNEIGVSTSYPQDLLTELKGALQDYAYG